MFIFSNRIFILLLISSTFSSTQQQQQQQSQNDNMCLMNDGILCIPDELKIMTTIAKGIRQTLLKIEQQIKQTKTIDQLNHDVNIEMNNNHFNLPLSIHHEKLSRHSNIHKGYFINLLLEGHDALVYYYNSIDDLLQLKGTIGEDIDKQFEKIQSNMRSEMICRYQNILNIYSQKWKSANEINDRIKFSKMRRLSPSKIHDIRSVVIIRYLRDWIEDIIDALTNVETKLV
ncbi:unnamed protein product [Adineta steineri]|uniref:Uncharacterized protein n=1 Tax=Adineta steineri TaxID=433720 RepID=A0A819IB00_9BILA|nr:unnamed protein product [Adineta steineri]